MATLKRAKELSEKVFSQGFEDGKAKLDSEASFILYWEKLNEGIGFKDNHNTITINKAKVNAHDVYLAGFTLGKYNGLIVSAAQAFADWWKNMGYPG